jgi:hypothetical protein
VYAKNHALWTARAAKKITTESIRSKTQDFDVFTEDIFKLADRTALRDLWEYLISHKIWVNKPTSGAPYATVLQEALQRYPRVTKQSGSLTNGLKKRSKNGKRFSQFNKLVQSNHYR